MHCPAEIAEVILPILQNGLLRVRALPGRGKPSSAASNPITFIISQIFLPTIPRKSSTTTGMWNALSTSGRWEWIRRLDGRNSGNNWATGSIKSTP